MTSTVSEPGEQLAAAHCERLVREGDPDRYFATLFAPADKRPHLFALYAFNLEVARIAEIVSEPLPGEIRLQWWRDTLQGEIRGDARANPVLAALEEAITRFRLPRQTFIDLIDARVTDLYDDPIPTVTDLEGYCGETSSALIRLATLVLADGREPGSADAAGHAGVAYAVTGLLRAFPWLARRGRVPIPQDILERYGVPPQTILAGQNSAGLGEALGAMRALARAHLERSRRQRDLVPLPVRAAYLPLALTDAYLTRMEVRDYDPFATVVELPQWRRQWILWWAARRG